MKAFATIFLGAIGAWQAFAQPVCPPINFQQLAQFRTENWPQSIVSGLVRQADGSFSQYVITGNVKAKTASVVGVVPDIQLSFFTCSGLAARNPKSGPAPNLSKDPLGTSSRNGIITDLAGDGVGAVVGPNAVYAPGQVVVVTANPDLTIRYVGSYNVGPYPEAVVAGDFNGDGKHDVATVYYAGANNGLGGIALLLGNGDGTLKQAVDYPTGNGVVAATAWDFNGDGFDDLAVVNDMDSTITILFGSASGKLTPGKTFSTGNGNFPGDVAVADVNGDGIPDLVVATFTGIVVFFGNGDGTFRPGPTTAAQAVLQFLATGDFNKDGKMDVALSDSVSGFVYILLGNGDGTFNLAEKYLLGYAATSFYVEDFDGDGNLDIVFACGHPDALFVQAFTQVVGVLFGNGDGTFAGAPAYVVPVTPDSMVTADFNGDGKPDLAIAGQPGGVSILLGSGGGGFQAGASLSSPNNSGLPIGVAAGDLNGDGKVDLAINDTQNGAAIFLGNGDGTFQAPRDVAGGGSGTSYVAIGDFSNDGKPDLAIANGGSNNVTILAGNGDGTFGAGVTVPVGSNPAVLLAADFNRDGNLDLAVVNYGTFASSSDPGGLSILLGKGDGTFQSATNYSASINPNSISVGDFNNDGIPDLVLTAAAPNFNYTLVVFIGNGDGTFKPGVLIPTAFGPETVAIADYNGDGKLDLVVPHCCGDTDITYLLGNGDGTFQSEVTITNGSVSTSVVADFNGDGKPDIAFGSSPGGPGANTALIFLNASATAAKQFATIVSAANPAGVAVAPGSLATAYGKDLANSKAAGTPLPLPTSFGGTSVSILDSNGNPSLASLLYVSPGQVNFEVPIGVATGTAAVTVSSGDRTQTIGTVQIAPVAPGLFELNSAGLAAAYVILYHADGTQTVEQVYKVSGGDVVTNPVSLGSSTDKPYLFLFGTGFEAAGTGGVKVSIGGTNVPVSFAGSQGGFAGLDQANVELPASLAGKGKVTIQLTADGLAANAVNITIQ